MPLHLLGKKSWNVYNAANIARVRRDEATAAAREAAEEQRMQEFDSARRLAILRGEDPPTLPPANATEPEPDPLPSFPAPEGRRKRKRAGEDDTDFEMRVARERTAAAGEAATRLTDSERAGYCAGPQSLLDERGHIALFAPADERATVGEEARREELRRRREEEELGAMRFSDAGGRGGIGVTDGGPWYAKSGAAVAEAPGKDVWGNEDPGRNVRQVARLEASDPLLMMKRGAAKVREVGKERAKEAEERERELRQLRREERHREKRRRRGGRDEEDVGDLEGFSLDAPAPERADGRHGNSLHYREQRHRASREDRVAKKDHHRSRSTRDDRQRHRHRHHRCSEP